MIPDPAPHPSWRKPAGAFMMVAIIAAWTMLCVSAVDAMGALPFWVRAVLYVVLGVAWVFPVRPVLVWMETGRWR